MENLKIGEKSYRYINRRFLYTYKKTGESAFTLNAGGNISQSCGSGLTITGSISKLLKIVIRISPQEKQDPGPTLKKQDPDPTRYT